MLIVSCVPSHFDCLDVDALWTFPIPSVYFVLCFYCRLVVFSPYLGFFTFNKYLL